MSESLLCGQIARYRKAAGMTQEELGQIGRASCRERV